MCVAVLKNIANSSIVPVGLKNESGAEDKSIVGTPSEMRSLLGIWLEEKHAIS